MLGFPRICSWMAALCAVLVALAACGGGGDDGNTGVALGSVSSGRPLDDLSRKEWRAVCDDLHDQVGTALDDDAVRRGLCLLHGAAALELTQSAKQQQALCMADMNSCLTAELHATNVFGPCSDLPEEGCDISTGELGRCMRAEI